MEVIIAVFLVTVSVCGAIFFAEWWNDKHGFDKRGNPQKFAYHHRKRAADSIG